MGGEWAERGGDTELQNIHGNVVEVETNVQTPKQKTRDGWELGGGWAEDGRSGGGAGRRECAEKDVGELMEGGRRVSGGWAEDGRSGGGAGRRECVERVA